MSLIERQLTDAWIEFKAYAQIEMGYTNQQNVNECVNGAGAFIDSLFGKKPRVGPSYATADRRPA